LITNNNNSIQSNLDLINSNTSEISNLKTGMAQSIAIGSLSKPEFGKSNISIAVGSYEGTKAIAIGYSKHNAANNTTFRLLGPQSNGVTSTAASFGWSF
jgi:autotransporter adhesin